ncbi:hypothetical protein [Oligoflexus sp.]|uniref:hypothetical protein n=1 Tax=Oligoflexus sp. TaxID=1971216 RepID=UPI002D77E637|nr:hypothetical protein [Oligoflexus sp.]
MVTELQQDWSFSSRRTGELEGYEPINGLMRARLLDNNVSSNENFAIEAIGGPGIFQVRGLLGYHDNTGEVYEFRAGEPNPFSAMLWYNQFALLAHEIGRNCERLPAALGSISFEGEQGAAEYRLQSSIVAMLPELCAWQQTSTPIRNRLQGLWMLVMSYDAPLQERDSWLQYFLESNHGLALGQERVAALFETMFMNPYFLLQE